MIYLAAENGLLVCDIEHEWHVIHHTLKSQYITSVAAHDGRILAGTTNGIYRSDDNGLTWQEANNGLSHRHVRWMAHHPEGPDLVFAGTEPACIFISKDNGNSWRACTEVEELRDHHEWSMPYSPNAGCVRGFAFHGSRLYAAVEVGGALRSDDSGETWRLAEGSDGNPSFDGPPPPFVYPDVHSIEVHPSSPDLVFAPTGGGFYRSSDGGKTWDYLYECYCRAMWADPADPAHLILGPADYVDSNGRIEETRDGGATWINASTGLNVPWRRHMVERFTQVEEELFAVLSNGELFAAPLNTLEWKRVFPDVKNVNAVAVIG